MKRIIFALLSLLILVSGYCLGKTSKADHLQKKYEMTIVCPGGAGNCSTWSISKYNNYEISWYLKPGYPGASWNIDLYRIENSSPVFVKRLVENVPSQHVTIGYTKLSDIHTGGTHYIIIRSVNNQAIGRSNDFTIIPDKIRVDRPNNGEIWSHPKADNLSLSYLISWSGGSPPYNVYLYKGPDMVRKICHNISANLIGLSGFSLKGIESGSDYYFEVRSANELLKGQSGRIQIINRLKAAAFKPEIKPAINILNLRQFAQYKTGDSLLVKWKMNVNNRVKIQLFRCAGNTPAGKVATLAEIPGAAQRINQYNWRNIPATIPTGNYCIRILTIDKRASNFSGVFSIKQAPPPTTRRR